MAYVFDDIINLEVPEDDVLAGEYGMGSCLPELSPADVLGLHAEADEDAIKEDLLGIEGSNAEMGDADPVDDVHLNMHEAVEVLLHLSSDHPASVLQGQDDTEVTALLLALMTPVTSTSCLTSETTPRHDAQMANGINLTVNDDDCDSDDSGQWSMDVNPPDDAMWCMSNVPDWEAGFSAWCSAHQGQSFHHMLPHCIIQCMTCLSTFSLTTDGFWYSQN